MTIQPKFLPWQWEFYTNKSKVKALSGASDTGKSRASQWHLILSCLENPGLRCVATASTYQQTYRAVIEPTMALCDEFGIEHVYKMNKHEGILSFCNDSRIEIFPEQDLYKRIRSREFGLFFIEEATIFSDNYIEKIFYEGLRRVRQGGKTGHLIMATNPDLKTRWLYENIFQSPPEWAWVRQLCFKDGWNANNKDRENLILMGSKRQIDLFYHGLWGNPEGVAFILEQGNHIRSVSEDEIDKYYITFDYGMSPDPMVYLLTAEKNGVIFVIDEIVLRGQPTNRHKPHLERWRRRYNIVGYTGETATGSFETRDLLNTFKFPYYATTKKRNAGWTTLADLIDTNRFVIDPRCQETIKSLSGMVWVGSTKGIDCDGEYDDPADALRYFIMCTWIYNRIAVRKRYARNDGTEAGLQTTQSKHL